ncbi:uncharacterized protein LOC126316671 [Schistocerca gregaria]|uniref:uncharacterized protein LOC126316671 n=1 Tax=Schistocerca gregaria TaxID=7010 RepID=UPI00211F2245|nr:uncharacterized protein LOC126316671 [Schistocerca gregaria]
MEAYEEDLNYDVPESLKRSRFSFFCQFQAFLKKSFTIQRRQHVTNLILVTFPFFMGILLGASQYMVNSFISSSPIDLYTEEIEHPLLTPHIIHAHEGDVAQASYLPSAVLYDSHNLPDVGVYGGPDLDGEEIPDGIRKWVESNWGVPRGILGNCSTSPKELLGIDTEYKSTNSYSQKALESLYQAIPYFVHLSQGQTMESSILDSWYQGGYSWAYEFVNASLSQRILNYSIFYNHTSGAQISIPVFENFISNGFFRAIRSSRPNSYLKNLGSKDFPSPRKINSLNVIISGIPLLPVVLALLNMIPPVTLFRGLIILANPFKGMSIDRPEYITDMNLYKTCMYLAAQCVVFGVLAFYFDQVLPIGPGLKKHYFFFLPKRWRPSRRTKSEKKMLEKLMENKTEPEMTEFEEADARGEKTLEICGLSKIFLRRPVKVAVRDLWMSIGKDECYGFLGPNGAGKSTVISMVCGYLRPSSGKICINNKNLLENREKIHLELGVCPQNDALYDKLTGPEHLEFYGKMKNLSGDQLKENIRYWLQKVNLWKKKDRNKLVSEYSGGMKRRLSVACALIGYPKLVLLDEPTTGLDPASRNELWKLIKIFKTKSAILLTTHSMKEAEVLCDVIGIIVQGSLRITGQAPELIRTRCQYYVIKVSLTLDNVEEVIESLQSFSPEVVFIGRLANQYTFEIPTKDVLLSKFFSFMKKERKRLKMRDWAIHNSTLERVFMSVAANSTESECLNTSTTSECIASIWNQLKGKFCRR